MESAMRARIMSFRSMMPNRPVNADIVRPASGPVHHYLNRLKEGSIR